LDFTNLLIDLHLKNIFLILFQKNIFVNFVFGSF